MNVTQLNDNALVALAAEQHNRKAFNELVVRYQSPIRRFFLNQTVGNEPLSDDLAQDTFVKAYLNITKFRGDSAFSTWLYRIAYNVFYDYTRSNKHTEDLETTEVARRNAEVSDTTVSLDLYEALNKLSSYERTCVTLQLMEGQPIDKIAEITGMAAGTVKSHLFRGKEKMTRYLKENGYDRKR